MGSSPMASLTPVRTPGGSARSDGAASSGGPGTDRRTAGTRLRAPLTAGAVGAAAVAYVAVVDPNRPGHYLTCPLLALTGWSCPACGGLRATHALTRGDLSTAWGLNPLWVLTLPVLLVGWTAWVRRSWRAGDGVRRRWRAPAWTRRAVPAGVLVYGVLRNLPLGVP